MAKTDDLGQNTAATISLCCGIASMVPLVILITFVPAIVLGFAGLIRAARLPGQPGRGAALWGIALAVGSLVVQAAIAGFAGLIGML